MPVPLDLLLHPLGVTRQLLRFGMVRPGAAGRAWISLELRRLHQDHLTAAASGHLLLEEGIVHHVWRALLLHPRLEQARWIPMLDAPCPLVVLEASGATRHAHIQAKRSPGKVNQTLARSGVEGAYWQRAEALLDIVIRQAAQVRTVVRVSTEGGLDDAVQRVGEAVNALARG